MLYYTFRMGRKGAFAVEHLSHSEQETEQLGEQVARKLPRGTVIAYTGELGMGNLLILL